MSSNVLLNSTCDEQDQKWGGLAPGSSVLVQGGSRGLGLAFVQFLLEQPECTQCFVSARNPTHSEALQQLQQQHPERLHLLSVELEDPQSIDRMCAQVQEHTSTLHMLLNVAGILHEGDE
ncbi:MAG: SDR family NAD(P)-dependent oxidoreductase, partial [Myxococcota bacterium]